jgi:hypothetical protein
MILKDPIKVKQKGANKYLLYLNFKQEIWYP